MNYFNHQIIELSSGRCDEEYYINHVLITRNGKTTKPKQLLLASDKVTEDVIKNAHIGFEYNDVKTNLISMELLFKLSPPIFSKNYIYVNIPNYLISRINLENISFNNNNELLIYLSHDTNTNTNTNTNENSNVKILESIIFDYEIMYDDNFKQGKNIYSDYFNFKQIENIYDGKINDTIEINALIGKSSKGIIIYADIEKFQSIEFSVHVNDEIKYTIMHLFNKTIISLYSKKISTDADIYYIPFNREIECEFEYLDNDIEFHMQKYDMHMTFLVSEPTHNVKIYNALNKHNLTPYNNNLK